jgi:hypothetical protein
MVEETKWRLGPTSSMTQQSQQSFSSCPGFRPIEHIEWLGMMAYDLRGLWKVYRKRLIPIEVLPPIQEMSPSHRFTHSARYLHCDTLTSLCSSKIGLQTPRTCGMYFVHFDHLPCSHGAQQEALKRPIREKWSGARNWPSPFGH